MKEPSENKIPYRMPPVEEEEEVSTPRATRFPKWVVPAAGVISVVISMVNGALAFGLLILWAYSGNTVTGGTGYTPVRELDFICAVALVGVIFGLIDICLRDGTRSWIWFAVVTVLGCLPNGFVFLVSKFLILQALE
jgi:hypothetical protein